MQNRKLKIKKLIFQSWHRGCKETDILLGSYAKACLNGLSDDELALYEEFINESDWDIYAWLVGTEPFPEKYQNSFASKIKEFKAMDN